MARSGAMTIDRVIVGTSATQLAAQQSGRESLLIRPIDGDIWVGDNDEVSSADGFLVKENEALTLENSEPVWAIAAGTVDVSVLAEV